MVRNLTTLVLLFLCLFVNAQSVDELILNHQFKKALSLVQSKQNEYPDSAYFWSREGLIYQKMHQNEAALHAYKYATAIDSTSFQNQLQLAYCYVNNTDYESANSILINLLHVDSLNTEVLYQLTENYYKQQNFKKAYQVARSLFLADSLSGDYAYLFGCVASINHRSDEAERVWRKLMENGTYNLNVYLKLASLYLNKGKKDLALMVCDRGEAVLKKRSELILKKGTIYFQFKDYKEAQPYFAEWLAGNDSIPSVLTKYGVCLYFNLEVEKALTILQNALLVNPRDPIVTFYIGLCYKHEKQFDKSEDFFKAAIELAQPDYLAEFYHHLGQVQNWQRELSASIHSYQRAYELDPSKVGLLFEIATTYEEEPGNQRTKALDYYSEFLRKADESSKEAEYAHARIQLLKKQLFFE